MEASTGEGLDILITCERTYLQNWMTFASWYSISVNLPDARVAIACSRSAQKHLLFEWTNRCGVNFFQYQKDANPAEIAFSRKYLNTKTPIILPPEVMAIREYDADNANPVDVKTNERATFVYYHEGCGKFVVSEWIDKCRTPFEGAMKRYGSYAMSINEISVFKLWERMYVASRGML